MNDSQAFTATVNRVVDLLIDNEGDGGAAMKAVLIFRKAVRKLNLNGEYAENVLRNTLFQVNSHKSTKWWNAFRIADAQVAAVVARRAMEQEAVA